MERPHGGIGAVRVLVALIALLLPAGAFAATTIGGRPPGREEGRVGAAGFRGELLAEDQPGVAPTVAVTSTVAPAPTVTVPITSAPAPAPTTTTLPRRTGTTTPTTVAMFPTPLGFPPLPMPTFPRSPSASAWSKTADGMTARMHIEPAAPVAGQPVTFVIDEVTAPVHCCVIHLGPDVGMTVPLPGANGPNPEAEICGSPSVTRSGLSYTHTYAEPGVYGVFLIAISQSCQLPAGSAGPAPKSGGVDIFGCITVGPASAIRAETVPPRCTGA